MKYLLVDYLPCAVIIISSVCMQVYYTDVFAYDCRNG